jgi:hypothetical protein
MTEPEIPMFTTDEEMEGRIRPLVNEILDRFNAEGITPAEAGMVILAMIYRLLGLLEEAPEARRFFILTLINLINNFLAGEMEGQA